MQFMDLTPIYMHAWETGSQVKIDLGRWIHFYNHQRLHRSWWAAAHHDLLAHTPA